MECFGDFQKHWCDLGIFILYLLDIFENLINSHWTLTDFAVLISGQLQKIAFFQIGSSVILTTDLCPFDYWFLIPPLVAEGLQLIDMSAI